ncbi:cation channel sperm-associated auxiliary subunit beta-like [Psammomys obesus]|uniref:cation channel sperm-associated auxiliary subunit beta-like n=1 Tax=Psammomys obesus TaxID=48139 RepID=UPI002452EB15|nr:cation channel sperm-associated auxiliary subunit beta-like [Psammomys obesus]
MSCKKENHLICFNEGASTDIQMMKLFLSSDNLRVHCFFQSENQVLSRAILSIFTTGGVAPNMVVMNSTYRGDFHFNLSLLNNQAFWLIDIPRENITVNTDIAAVEQWIIKITMHEGLNIYDTEGTLLDLVREPILQWSLGPTMNKTQVKQLYPHVIDIIVTKCPCANDVALLGLILDSTSNGVYIGKTISGFWKVDGTIWHDMTKIIYAELKDEHKGLTVIDMILTNHFLVILTSLGLFISPDLRYPITSHIQLSRAEFCGFERGCSVPTQKKEHLRVGHKLPCELPTTLFLITLSHSTFNTFSSTHKHVLPVLKLKTGNAYIREIFRHTSGNVGFYSSVLTEIIEPFGMEVINDSPCLDSNLSISIIGPNMVKLSLEPRNYPNVFKDTDVEKTVVIPGHSSFMVIEITDEWTAFAIATMPDTVNSDLTFAAHSWLLYNFGSKSGRNWAIHLKPCNYWVRTDLISLNAVKYTDMGNKEEFKYQVIPNTRGMIPRQIPPVTVIIGNPTLLEVMANGHFDISDDYHMKIQIASKFFHRGSTSLALVLWDASTDCLVTTLVTTMKSSCSYLRTMHHVPDTYIPPEDWTSGVHEDSLGFNMIKTLPVNYRPPSNMGISIPLTDNFYHADPSKPIPRNLFQKSKETGKYKQCANATRREMCNCTEHQKFSHAVAFSDCKEKVHRYKFPVTQYPVVLEIFNEGEKFSVEPPYLVTVTEVNMRKNWEIKHIVPENLKKLKAYLESRLKTPVYNPLGLNLSIRGSELFHFRVSVVPGVSFCDLAEEFQIYVDEVPLPFPGHTLIAVGTSVVIGGLIFTSFLFQLRNIHPLRAFWRHSRGHFAMSSFSSIGS